MFHCFVSKNGRGLEGVNSDVKCKGLERSQFGCFAVYIASEGLERSQFLTFCCNSHCKGLERSQIGLKCHVCHSSLSQCPHTVLDEV